MAQASDYTALITSQHAGKPNFTAMVAAVAQCFADQQNFLATVPGLFDVDTAAGAQLDAVGLWVGVTRNLNVPILGVFFSFDTAGLGFDQGVWLGPGAPPTYVVTVDDDTYRLLIHYKIAANNWNGTLENGAGFINIGNTGSNIFLVDNQDMSMNFGVSGTIPSALFLALLKAGVATIKPEGVLLAGVSVTSVDGQPIFGFDASNQFIAGFDSASWATTL